MRKIFKLTMFLFICAFFGVLNSNASKTDEIKRQSYFNFRQKYSFGFTTHNLYFSKQKLKSNNHPIYNFHLPYNK